MKRSRRDFLRCCAALGAAGAAAPLERLGAVTAHAQASSAYKALVCIFLNGGNDSNNMILPVDSRYAAYASMRGPVALGSGAILPAGTGGLGFHPALVNIHRLYGQGAVAMALNVGTLVQPVTKLNFWSVPRPANLLSHSDQTQQWQSSDPTGTTGWGGRIVDLMSGYNTGTLSGVTAGAGNPLFLSGVRNSAIDIASLSTSGLRSFGSSANMATRATALQRLLTFDSGLKLVTAANGVLTDSLSSFQEINAALASAPPLPMTFPATGIGRQLAQIASLISVRGALGMNRQVFFVNIGGFDHHEQLLTSQHSLLLQVDQAVNAFFGTLEAFAMTNQVTVFTESEFNRTANSNATLGTDHAWGGHHVVIGGAVRGGAFGTFPTLQIDGPDDWSGRGSWIPTTSLDQYAATLATWFGVGDADLDSVFPNLRNFASRRMEFLPNNPFEFSDEPLTPTGSPIRSTHLTELRAAIGVLRTRYALGAAPWTDPVIAPGVTVIKLAHLTELRTALGEVYAAAGRLSPEYTDATARFTPIAAVHIAELRAAVRAIW
jgi:uncharacterized protein (DUF1501 family)